MGSNSPDPASRHVSSNNNLTPFDRFHNESDSLLISMKSAQGGSKDLRIGQVLSISDSTLSMTFRSMLEARLLGTGPQTRLLPSPLLSDDEGLKLWSQITRMPRYYQTRDEIELLKSNGREVAEHIIAGCTLLDLGSGDVSKIMPLLDHLEALHKPVNYFALDLSHETLVDAMSLLSTRYKYVRCFGLWGSFDDGLKWVDSVSGPRFFCSLGSIFGNDFLDSAVERLKPWVNIMRPDDRMLLGMDGTTNYDDIWQSYHDPNGVFEKFMRNGLVHSNRVLQHCWYKDEDWKVLGILEKEPAVMHRFVFRARREVSCLPANLHIPAGGEIDCYEAFKYGPETMRRQFDRTGLEELATWLAPSKRIRKSADSTSPDFADTMSLP